MAEEKVIAIAGATGAQGGSLAQAILNDPDRDFAVRALTRDPRSDKAKALTEQGAEVVEADLDEPDTVKEAFAGAYGAYCVTFYWEHYSPEKELVHARTMAEAAEEAGLEHVIWSTLEDTRKWVPLDDDRMPTLMDHYKVPHFDAKGEADRFFEETGVPTTYLLPSFYWNNMIHFGSGPQRMEDGELAIVFPMGDKKLAGIAAEDIGKCTYGIFKQRDDYIGERVGLAGEHLTGDEMAAALTEALGRTVHYHAVSPETYRSFDFPGADDVGNMFQFYRDFDEDVLAIRDVERSRALNSELKSFEEWLAENKDRIPIES